MHVILFIIFIVVQVLSWWIGCILVWFL